MKRKHPALHDCYSLPLGISKKTFSEMALFLIVLTPAKHKKYSNQSQGKFQCSPMFPLKAQIYAILDAHCMQMIKFQSQCFCRGNSRVQ